MRWLEVLREEREGRCRAGGPKRRGGLMVVRVKVGLGVEVKAKAARSA